MKYSAFALSLFSLLVILQNTSCTGNKYPKETQMLDSMKTFVVKADSAAKTIDSAKITDYAKHVMNDNQLIEMMHIDTMSHGATSIFRDFNSIRWSFLTIAGRKGPLLKELEKSKNQLGHLSHDIQHNLVISDSVGYYVAFETKKAAELIQVTNMSVGEINKELPQYIALTPKADSLISLLKEHKKI
jgi:hypothetical protein